MSTTSQKKKGRNLRMHKGIGRPWHEESTLVFKSKDEKVVIGRCENEVFVDLDDETIALADEWKFHLDPELVDMDGEEVDGEEVDGEEVETPTPVPSSHVNTVIENEVTEEVDSITEEVDDVEEAVVSENMSLSQKTTESCSGLRQEVDKVIASSLNKVFNELSDKNTELSSLQDAHKNLQKQYKDLQYANKKLEAKFKAMKELFS